MAVPEVMRRDLDIARGTARVRDREVKMLLTHRMPYSIRTHFQPKQRKVVLYRGRVYHNSLIVGSLGLPVRSRPIT